MPTMNEALFDASVRHQIKVLRFTKGEVARAEALLRQSDQEIVALLRNSDLTEWSEKRLKAQLAEIRRLRVAVAAQVKEQIAKQAEEFALNESNWELDTLAATSPVLLPLNAVTPQVLKAVAGSPVNGVPLDGWLGQMVSSDVTKVEQALRLGILQGETKDQMVRRVLDLADVNRANASTIVRTTYNHVSNASKQAVWSQNADILEGVRWSAVLDGRTSPVCRSRDGEVFPVESGPRPPAHPNCRSQVVPVVRGEKVVGDRPFVRDSRTRDVREKDFRAEAKEAAGPAWADMSAAQRNAAVKARREAWTAENIGSVPSTTNYDTWLRRQPKAFQDDVLGKGRGQLFRDGMTLDKFVDETGRQYSLAELKAETMGDALNVVQPGVGIKAKALLQQGLTNEEVLEAIKAEFPDANTGAASIASYKSELKKAGLLDPLDMTTNLPNPVALKTNEAVSDLVETFEGNLPEGVQAALGGQWITLVDEMVGGAPGSYAYYQAGKGVTASYKKLGGVSPMQATQILAHELGHLLHKQHSVALSAEDLAQLAPTIQAMPTFMKKQYAYYFTNLDELVAEIYSQALSPSPYTSQGLLSADFTYAFKAQIAAAKKAIDDKFPKPAGVVTPVSGGAPTMPFEVAGKHTSIGSLAKALLQQGLPDDQVLLAVKAQFPDGKTGMASIKSYKSELKKQGKLSNGSGPVVVAKAPAPIQPSKLTPNSSSAAVLQQEKTVDTIMKSRYSLQKQTTEALQSVTGELIEAGVVDPFDILSIFDVMLPGESHLSQFMIKQWKMAFKKANPAAFKKGLAKAQAAAQAGIKIGPPKVPELYGKPLGPKSTQVFQEVKKKIETSPGQKYDQAELVDFIHKSFGGGSTVNVKGAQDLIDLAHYEIMTGKSAAKPYLNAVASAKAPPIAAAPKVDMTPTRLASTPSEGFPPPPRYTAAQRAAGLKEFNVQPDPSLAQKLNAKHGLKGDAAITPEEAAAMKAYTSGLYSRLNPPLRNGQYASRPALQAYVDAAQHGMAKLPKYRGLSSRGIGRLDGAELDNMLKTYHPGAVVEEHAFTSSSAGEKAAFSGKVYFKITGRSGVDVSGFSYYPGEREVLFAPGTRFRVDKVEKVGNNYIIYKTEI